VQSDPAQAASEPSDNGHSQGQPKVVVVQIRPGPKWRETCREVVQLAGRYEGVDSLRISVSGRQMAMEFPNLSTHFCPELVRDVKRLPAISGVSAI
jgi:hypothetical protein